MNQPNISLQQSFLGNLLQTTVPSLCPGNYTAAVPHKFAKRTANLFCTFGPKVQSLTWTTWKLSFASTAQERTTPSSNSNILLSGETRSKPPNCLQSGEPHSILMPSSESHCAIQPFRVPDLRATSSRIINTLILPGFSHLQVKTKNVPVQNCRTNFV